VEYHLPAHVTAQLAGLPLSEDQDRFWCDDARLLRLAPVILLKLDKLERCERDRFWQGEIPPGLFDLGGPGGKTFLLGMPARTIVAYVKAQLSNDHTWEAIRLRACRVKTDKDVLHQCGRKVPDKRSLALFQARNEKRIDPKMLEEANRRGNRGFKNALHRAMKEGTRSGDLPVATWHGISPRQSLLIGCWCQWPAPCEYMPPLCLFTGDARTTLVAMLLDVEDNWQLNCAMRKEIAADLKLYKPHTGLIGRVESKDGAIRFIR
jgi:hypothetical protein